MKIHTSNEVQYRMLYAAARFAADMTGKPVVLDTLTERLYSRSHDLAFEVGLTLNQDHGQRTADGRGRAAGYEAWGYFLAAVFAIDPDAKLGPYKGVDDFNAKTRDGFRDVSRDDMAARLYAANRATS